MLRFFLATAAPLADQLGSDHAARAAAASGTMTPAVTNHTFCLFIGTCSSSGSQMFVKELKERARFFHPLDRTFNFSG